MWPCNVGCIIAVTYIGLHLSSYPEQYKKTRVSTLSFVIYVLCVHQLCMAVFARYILCSVCSLAPEPKIHLELFTVTPVTSSEKSGRQLRLTCTYCSMCIARDRRWLCALRSIVGPWNRRKCILCSKHTKQNVQVIYCTTYLAKLRLACGIHAETLSDFVADNKASLQTASGTSSISTQSLADLAQETFYPTSIACNRWLSEYPLMSRLAGPHEYPGSHVNMNKSRTEGHRDMRSLSFYGSSNSTNP